MSFIFQGYDLTLAVIAKRALSFETHDDKGREIFAWEPAQKFLGEMTLHHPKQITCFFGKPYRMPNDLQGLCVNLYVANAYKGVIYIGTVFCKYGFTDYCNRRIEYFKEMLILLKFKKVKEVTKTRKEIKKWNLLIKNPKVFRDPCFCFIPIEKEEINDCNIIAGARAYLAEFMPKLDPRTIYLLSAKTGELLDSVIRQEAERTAWNQDSPHSESDKS